jgi:hypothetical protein
MLRLKLAFPARKLFFCFAQHTAMPPYTVWRFLPAAPEVYRAQDSYADIFVEIVTYCLTPEDAAASIDTAEAAIPRTVTLNSGDKIVRRDTESREMGADPERDDTGAVYYFGRIRLALWLERSL